MRLERALRKSEEKFSKAFRASPIEIAITTLQEGMFLDVNEAFERNTGFTREELIGHTSLELGLWENLDERAATIEHLKTNGGVRGREIRFRTKSGGTRVTRYSAEPIVLEHRQCLLAVSEDITAHKHSQEVLHQTEERYAAILDQCPNLTFLKDLEGRYLFINKEYASTFRVARDQIYGKKDVEMYPPDQAAVFRASDLRVLRARARMELEEVVLHDDGPHTQIVHKFPLFGALGEMHAICGVVTDITQRKRDEEELRRLSGQLLRSQDEERRRIARELHDSTGQNLVALAATLVHIKRLIPSSNRKPRKLVAECQSLTDLCIREVRTLSYLLHPPMLDETGIEDAIRHYVDGFTKRSSIRVALEVTPRFGRMTRNAELALFRVVQEGLTNIQRHSGSSNARIRLDRTPEKVTLEVSDKGHGMPGLNQTGDGTLPPDAGVGILSMVERVKQIGGLLVIESDDKGATLRVTLPAYA